MYHRARSGVRDRRAARLAHEDSAFGVRLMRRRLAQLGSCVLVCLTGEAAPLALMVVAFMAPVLIPQRAECNSCQAPIFRTSGNFDAGTASYSYVQEDVRAPAPLMAAGTAFRIAVRPDKPS